jgi:hypothetical protein
MSSKRADFERFAKVCELIGAGAHLSRDGFEAVVRLATAMNTPGKRNYSAALILNGCLRP